MHQCDKASGTNFTEYLKVGKCYHVYVILCYNNIVDILKVFCELV